MYFNRNIDKVLTEWASSESRKPLVLRGARQTGKTSAVREFGKGFDLFIELNLERHRDLSLVRACRSADDLLSAIMVRGNLRGFPQRTLIFFDEVQASPQVISWLRFFHEDRPELAVVAAGSHMEVRLEEKGFSFPVGRVTFRTLFPFTFLEFLGAVGKNALRDMLIASAEDMQPVPPPVHNEAFLALLDYLLVGGMPEAVSRWSQTSNLTSVREAQEDIIQSLAEDIQKYRTGRDVTYIEAAFENLKHHYGKRFKYESFAPGFRSQLMQAAISKLEGALLVTRVWPSSSLKAPIAVKPKSAPKLLPMDMGIALHTMGQGYDALRSMPMHRVLDGRAAEMFVGLEILAAQGASDKPLCFWVNESPRGNAEVDYLLTHKGALLPVEVKAGPSGTLKSLHQFLERAGLRTAIRFHSDSLADEIHRVKSGAEELRYRLVSVPLYLAGRILSIANRLDLEAESQ